MFKYKKVQENSGKSPDRQNRSQAILEDLPYANFGSMTTLADGPTDWWTDEADNIGPAVSPMQWVQKVDKISLKPRQNCSLASFSHHGWPF